MWGLNASVTGGHEGRGARLQDLNTSDCETIVTIRLS